MIYDTLSKGEDGLYHTRALNDENKRHFIQLNGVTVSDVDQELGEVSFEVTGDDNQSGCRRRTCYQPSVRIGKIVKLGSVKNFRRKLFQVLIRGENLATDRISATRIFDHNKETTSSLLPKRVKRVQRARRIFRLWFAKKAFGPSRNIVQLKIHEEKIPEPEPEPEPTPEVVEEETYPDQYMIQDSE